MKHQYDYAVLGGDLRQVYLAEALADQGNRVCHHALCASPDPCRCQAPSSLTAEDSLEKICSLSSCVVCPIPLSRDGKFLNQSAAGGAFSIDQLVRNLNPGQFFFAGCIPGPVKEELRQKNVHTIDLMEDPSFCRFNSTATAEGALCEAIANSPLTLHHSSCAVLGYGNCGSALCAYLKGMFCRLYVASREEGERAQAALFADRTGSLEEFQRCVGAFDFIFNTIPAMVLPAPVLKNLKHSVTILDIASAPGGVDYASAKELGIRALPCPGLPGRYAPGSSAKVIKEIIERYVKGDSKCL